MRRVALLGLFLAACGPKMDEYFLTYETYPGLGSKQTWKLAVLPPTGYMQYTEIPREPYGKFWLYMLYALDGTDRFKVVTPDTSAMRAAIAEKAPGWESFPESGTGIAVGKELGAEAVCIVEIKQILIGHKYNDPSQPMYYEVVLGTKIFDVASGDLLYNATSRGKVYEDLAGSLNQAVDNAVKPFGKQAP